MLMSAHIQPTKSSKGRLASFNSLRSFSCICRMQIFYWPGTAEPRPVATEFRMQSGISNLIAHSKTQGAVAVGSDAVSGDEFVTT
jgi:hypothetical protein